MAAPLKTFIIYSSLDRDLRDEFLQHLKPLERAQKISVWSDAEIPPGEPWNNEIQEKLHETELFIPLISKNFFNSKYIEEVELPFAEQQRKTGHAFVIPVLLSACAYKYDPIVGQLEVIPKDKPIISAQAWENADVAWEYVIEKIGERAKKILEDPDFLKKRQEIKEKKADEAAWQKALQSGTIAAFEKYLENPAHHLHRTAATQRLEALKIEQQKAADEAAWQRALQSGTIAAFEKYLENPAHQRHHVEATQRLEALKADESAWQKALQSGTIAAFEKYLENPAHHLHRSEATQRLDELKIEQQKAADEAAWQKAYRADTIEALEAYLANPSHQLHRSEATQRLEELKKAKSQPPYLRWAAIGIGALLALFLIARAIGCGGCNSEDVKPIDPVEPPVPAPSRPDMVFIRGGTFTMGCTSEQRDCDGDESPTFKATVSDFYLSRYEVTNESFVEFLNSISNKIALDGNGDRVSLNGNPIFDNFCGDRKGGCSGFEEMIEYDNGTRPGGRFKVVSGYAKHPVVLVSWYGAVEYCNWLSDREGLRKVYTIRGREVEADWSANGYRLPTEAEWEYAARGGVQSKGYKYAGSDNLDEVAWYLKNSGRKTHPVGEKKPNELGLHDMSGNVWEWCWDWKDAYSSGAKTNPRGPEKGSFRVLRGGSWYYLAEYCRVSNRNDHDPGNRAGYGGFRVALVP